MTQTYNVTVDGCEFEFESDLKIWDGYGDQIAELAVAHWHDNLDGWEHLPHAPVPIPVTITLGDNTREFEVDVDFSPTFSAYEKQC